MKIFKIATSLTPNEIAIIQWALDPLTETFTTPEGAYERGGNIYDSSQLPRIENGQLIPSPIEEINEDLQYRITIDLEDVCDAAGGYNPIKGWDEEGKSAQSTKKTISRLKKKMGWS